MDRLDIIAIVLAGGKGSRLGELTDRRAKPALPVAGTYRLVDIVLSNLVHSGISDVWMIEQYLPGSLNEHLAHGRPWDLDRSWGGLQVLPPFEGTEGSGFAQGNADAIARQVEALRDRSPDVVLVLSADHLYTLDLRDVLETHTNADADLTVVTTTGVPDASRHGVLETDDDGRVTGFAYKPDEPATDLVAAEIFVYRTTALLDTIDELLKKHDQLDDYGDQLVPHLVDHARVVEHRLESYWRDLGTINGYWQAHMDLLDRTGVRLDDPQWPIRTAAPVRLPAWLAPSAEVHEALLAPGSRVAGSVRHSVVGPDCQIAEGAEVIDSVLLEGVSVGAGVRLVGVVADAGAEITGGSARGSDDAVTLISADGSVSDREPREG
ncbi:NTP transferase domain-containing protein [Mumia sp. zg.B17]|uniref:glucose-1-phosphate adenylyltransferase family protein n=1 Tax=unclassified Mumia TaxID=2621872 RepID=UPI001C6EC57C|nr:MULTISPECIES: sugar phosphate nucleotidyltransferase [unclassified Mumia]MBW9204994.1 NTP transferase domain-containing protein [Mumia sp. zg.B17]MDD9347484.1 sugar phosphate nucleotidyltransferase [Mumia sp.]